MDKFIDVLFYIIIGLCLVMSIWGMMQIANARKYEVDVFYDCRLAEISPDIPPAIKEECRKRMEK